MLKTNIYDIIPKLKNKIDFNSVVITTKKAIIFVNLVKTYFEPVTHYNIIIDYFNGKRKSHIYKTKDETLKILKHYKIMSVEQ